MVLHTKMQAGTMTPEQARWQTFPAASQPGDETEFFSEWLWQAAPIRTICIKRQFGEALSFSTPQIWLRIYTSTSSQSHHHLCDPGDISMPWLLPSLTLEHKAFPSCQPPSWNSTIYKSHRTGISIKSHIFLQSVQPEAQNSADECHLFHQTQFSFHCWNPDA